MLIKKLTKGNFTLTHDRYRDDNGFLRDHFEIMETGRADRITMHTPFMPPFKVKTVTGDQDVMDTTTDYTEEEYEAMLNTP